MIARSAYTQLRHSPALLALGGLAWLLMAGTFVPMLRYYGQPVADALLLPGTALLYALMTVDSARRHAAGRGAAWKGRTHTRAR